MHYRYTTVDCVSVESGLLTPPLVGKIVTANVDIGCSERSGSSLNVDGIRVLVAHSLKIKGLETVSTEFIENDLGLGLVRCTNGAGGGGPPLQGGAPPAFQLSRKGRAPEARIKTMPQVLNNKKTAPNILLILICIRSRIHWRCHRRNRRHPNGNNGSFQSRQDRSAK